MKKQSKHNYVAIVSVILSWVLALVSRWTKRFLMDRVAQNEMLKLIIKLFQSYIVSLTDKIYI
ncbi:hypothetical protein CDG79_15900 [Nostoc sp. 'Peltigera membranacea cyanobiont' 232]|nr:hypothetical protein CDG79_15900 [Nostoc sp. 'Peltigera membranacea cyanobiont' 232]